MKPLYEYITQKEPTVVVPRYDLKTTPLQLGRKIDEIVEDFLNGQGKDDTVKAVGRWFEKNQNRRNVKTGTYCGVVLYIADLENKLLMDVINELERIGVSNMGGEFSPVSKWSTGGVNCGRVDIKFSVATYKQFREKNYNYQVLRYLDPMTFKKCSYGNGYNDLPAEDMNVLRQKLYDCMTTTTCEVLAFPPSRNVIEIPEYRVVLTAQYDKRKLKELLNFLKNDKRYQNFADRMDDMSRGIEAYYASKRPGEYVGD